MEATGRACGGVVTMLLIVAAVLGLEQQLQPAPPGVVGCDKWPAARSFCNGPASAFERGVGYPQGGDGGAGFRVEHRNLRRVVVVKPGDAPTDNRGGGRALVRSEKRMHLLRSLQLRRDRPA